MAFYKKSLQNHPSYVHHIAPTNVQHGLIQTTHAQSGQVTHKKADSSSVIAQHKVIVNCQPSTTVDANLLNGGLIEFRLEKGYVDILDHIYVKIVVNNNTGAGVTLAPSQLMLDRWEIYGNNGNKLLFQKYGVEMWQDNIYLSRNEWEVIAPYLNTNANYASTGTVVANGAQRTFYIPLIAFFTPTKLHLGGLSGQLLIRLRFNTSAYTILAGTVPPTVDCALQLRGRMEPDEIKQERNNSYMHLHHSLSFLGVQRMAQQLTLAASTQYSIVLSGIQGIASTFYFTIRALPLTGANQVTFIPVQDFDVQEQDGRSMIGFYRRTFDDMRLDVSECFNNLFINYVNTHIVPFSNNPVQDYVKGSNHGYQCFTSFEKLSFTTTAALVPGNYQIDIYCSAHESAFIDNGILTTSRN